MRATLHQGAANTYYGQWTPERTAISGLQSPSIARNEVGASAKFVAMEARGRVFVRKAGLGLREFYPGPKNKFPGEPVATRTSARGTA